MREITNRQQEVLNYIKGYIKSHKYPPTIREISQNFSISVKGAYDHVKALEKKNYIHCSTHQSRSIEVLDDNSEEEDKTLRVPILGSVAAGTPLFSEENYEGAIRIPAEYVQKGKSFALHVKGDSMIDAGIMDGDVAIICHQQTAENGDIVVAMVNEAVTLKRIYKEKNRIKLKSENPVYPPIFAQSVRILGKLSHIIRYYD
jgi:repressor LexA